MDMSNVVDAIKRNPALVIGAALVLVLVLRSSGAATSGDASADPDAVLAANTQVTLAQLEQQGQLNVLNTQAQASVAVAGLDASVAMSQIAATAKNNEYQYNVALASLSAQTVNAANQMAAQLEMAKLESQTAQFSVQQNAAISIAQIQQQAAAVASNNQTQQIITAFSAQVSNYQTNAMRDIAITQSNNLVQQQAIMANAQVNMARIQAEAMQSDGILGSLASLASIAAMFI